jgi:hypothetical protein
MSKGDLIEMNNSWQFCLSIQEVDLLFEYLDLSQNGQINLHSWSRALDPFYTAINAMGRCFHRIVKTKAPKDSGAADADVKMKTKYSFDAAADVCFKRLDKNGDGTLMLTDVKRFFYELPNFKYPEAHVRIFYEHLKYFTDSGILPCHWSAAFDLITSDEIHEISNTDDISYAKVL